MCSSVTIHSMCARTSVFHGMKHVFTLYCYEKDQSSHPVPKKHRGPINAKTWDTARYCHFFPIQACDEEMYA